MFYFCYTANIADFNSTNIGENVLIWMQQVLDNKQIPRFMNDTLAKLIPQISEHHPNTNPSWMIKNLQLVTGDLSSLEASAFLHLYYTEAHGLVQVALLIHAGGISSNHCEYWKCINQEMHCANTERSGEEVENDVSQNDWVSQGTVHTTHWPCMAASTVDMKRILMLLVTN